MILPGFRTAAEDSMKRGGTGDEIFYSICGLMASGARTVVLSRWKTAGQSTYDLNNEFFGQMQNLAAADAWRAAVDKLRMSDVDAALVPGAFSPSQCSTGDNPGDQCGSSCADPAAFMQNNARPDVRRPHGLLSHSEA